MYLAALVFTILGWAFQSYETIIKKTRNINVILPLSYFIACVLFGISSYTSGDIFYAIIDAVCAILAAIVFIILLTQKKLSK